MVFDEKNDRNLLPVGVSPPPPPPIYFLLPPFAAQFCSRNISARKEANDAVAELSYPTAPNERRPPFLLGVGGPGFWYNVDRRTSDDIDDIILSSSVPRCDGGNI